MLTDSHNHTCHFSPDAKTTIDELIMTASSLCIPRVAVTEHYELDNPDPEDDIGIFDLDSYLNTFGEWKKKCPAGLELLMGIEFGYRKEIASRLDDIADSYPFDTVILSNHMFYDRDVYFNRDIVYSLPVKERQKIYIGRMAEMANRMNGYDIIAHYDYINKYNPEVSESVMYDDSPKEFDDLFEVIISKEKALEINTSYYAERKTAGDRNILPDEKLIRKYLEMGGRLVSIGSDSHTKEALSQHFKEVSEYLKFCGIKEVVYFSKRRPYTEGL